MSYNAPFDPTPKNVGFDPNKRSNVYSNSTVSLVPDCDTISLTQERMATEVESFLNNMGYVVMYIPTRYDLNNHDKLLGEDVYSVFRDAVPIKGFYEVAASQHMWSMLGEENKKDVILHVSKRGFTETFGSGNYPKIGDLFYIKNSDCGDIERTHPEVFEVTDKNIGIEKEGDLLFGGYTWKIEARRFDYSYERNAPIENTDNQYTNDDYVGLMEAEDEYTPTVIDNVVSASEKDLSNKRKNIYGTAL